MKEFKFDIQRFVEMINGTESADEIIRIEAYSYKPNGIFYRQVVVIGKDTLEPNSTEIIINALGGNDSIRNYDYPNTTIIGGDGLDYFYNMSSYVSINGGNDSDTIYNSSSYVSISGGEGNDSIRTQGVLNSKPKH